VPIALLVLGGFFFGMLLFAEVGRQIGRARIARDPAGLTQGVGAAEAAMLALLGLLVAFTFSGAASRFEDRRHLIGTEANAIGTAYLRLDLLTGDARPRMQELFRRYLDVRLATYRSTADVAATEAKLAEGAALQTEIWTTAVADAKTSETPREAFVLLLPALNEMIDITTTREVATQNHPPLAVFLLLAAMSFVGSLLFGYNTSANKGRSLLHTIIFAVVMSVTVYMIVDLEFPRRGLIRVDGADDVLVKLRDSME
jgi:hypothetical protein